jgi:uncharacterized membrane protein YeaQ/YmgE (transglycosylase-associated protein family)
MTNSILWIVSGGLAGWVATLIMGNDGSLGILGNIVVGIIGAFIGGFIMDKLGHGGADGADRPTSIASFATAVIGAVVLLFIARLF